MLEETVSNTGFPLPISNMSLFDEGCRGAIPPISSVCHFYKSSSFATSKDVNLVRSFAFLISLVKLTSNVKAVKWASFGASVPGIADSNLLGS